MINTGDVDDLDMKIDRRGEDARRALLDAAIDQFARSGFDAVTTRKIAEEAAVNQAMISYYFGGKEGLYMAAIEHIAESLNQRLGEVGAAVTAEWQRLDAAGDAAADEYLAPLFRMTDRLVEVMVADETRAWSRIILREQQDPGPAFDVLYEQFMGRTLNRLIRLFAAARGGARPTKRDRLSIITVVGQILVFRVSNAAVLRLMDWQRIGTREIGEIQSQVRANITAMARAEG